MRRNLKVNRKFWVAFGLLAISLRIFTGAPEAQVSFSSLLVDQKISQTQNSDQPNNNVDVFASSDAHTIPEKHRETATYKKYISPDNFLVTLFHETLEPELRNRSQQFVNYYSGVKSVYRPTSHSPPAVVSTHFPVHTTTTVDSVALEKNFGEIKDTYSWEFNRI